MPNFEAAVDAIVGGDVAALARLLHDHPELARARSTRAHRSTLLHYVSANGVEDFRQKTPANILEITKLLLKAGADVALWVTTGEVPAVLDRLESAVASGELSPAAVDASVHRLAAVKGPSPQCGR